MQTAWKFSAATDSRHSNFSVNGICNYGYTKGE